MPLYEYQCSACGNRFEDLVAVDAPAPACPSCGGAQVTCILSSVCGRTSDKGSATPFAPGPFPTSLGGGCGGGGGFS